MTEEKKELVVISAIEKALIDGDLSALTESERANYYNSFCQSIGVNPLAKPFSYLRLNGKLCLYANKACTDELRVNHCISVTKLTTKIENGICWVVAEGVNAKGRQDCSTGAVNVEGAKGDQLCNLVMKAETKAKRRLTLSLAGLGILDETEIETIPREVREVKEEVKQIEVVKPRYWYYSLLQAPEEKKEAIEGHLLENECILVNESLKVWRSNKELPKMKNYKTEYKEN